MSSDEFIVRPAARVWVADISGEEFQEAERGALAGYSDECRHNMRANVTDDSGSVDDDEELLSHCRGFRMLPGGTPPSFSVR